MPGTTPLRLDPPLRALLATRGDPVDHEALARLLAAHHAHAEALALLPPGPAPLRWQVLRHAGPAALQPPLPLAGATGRDAFVVALRTGQVSAAADIAAATPGAAGAALRAELRLRRGQRPTGPLDPLNAARRAFLDDQLPEALRLARSVSGPDRGEALLVGVAALRRQGEDRAAKALLDEAMGTPGPVLAGAVLESALLRLQRSHLLVFGTEELRELRWALDGPVPERLVVGQIQRVRRRLERVSRALGPFRGEVPSQAVGGHVVPVLGALGLRARLAALRASLRVQPLETVLGRFAALEAAHPDRYLVPMYAAELQLWFGQTAAAQARLERVVAQEPHARWAWIGLAQARLWQGQHRAARRATATLRRRHPGLPTLPALEGELHLALGQPARALSALNTALTAHPTRWSAHVLRARALLQLGQSDAAAHVLERLRGLAPDAFTDPAQDNDTETVLDDHLQRLRGNRSSSFVTLRGPDGAEQVLDDGVLEALRSGPLHG